MRHLKKGRKFHRKTGPRRAFLRGLVCNLIRYERIETTEARAKETRAFTERAITLAKHGDLAHRRILLSRLQNETVVRKLMDTLAPRYKERKGGYLRIVKQAKARKRDGTQLAVISFV